jgi:RNA polymerase sigma factor (sigma-70 family)
MPLTPEQSQMVEDNMGLIWHTAKQINKKNYPLEFDEIVNICYIALVRCVQKFDPSKGFTISTYAVKTMQWSVYKEVHPKKPRVESLYLEDVISDDGKSKWEQFMAGESPENEIVCEVAKEQIKDYVYAKLKPNHRDIFLIHYQNPELTQKEVGELAGCSQVNVSRVYRGIQKQLANVAM